LHKIDFAYVFWGISFCQNPSLKIAFEKLAAMVGPIVESRNL